MYSKKAFLGVNAGLDFEIASQKATFTYVGLCTGFDFAIPTKKKENLAVFHLGVGPLMLVGDYENRVAFMLGTGLDLRFTMWWSVPRNSHGLPITRWVQAARFA